MMTMMMMTTKIDYRLGMPKAVAVRQRLAAFMFHLLIKSRVRWQFASNCMRQRTSEASMPLTLLLYLIMRGRESFWLSLMRKLLVVTTHYEVVLTF